MHGSEHPASTDREADSLFPGAGELEALCRATAWARTPLGPAREWPEGLKALVRLVMTLPVPAMVLWGPELAQIYNDGFREVMGARHPAGLGQPTRACWPEVWHLNAPVYERVRAGESVSMRDALFPVTRSGARADAWFDLSYTPVRGEAGVVDGILVTATETTERVLERRRHAQVEAALKAREARQAFLLELSDRLRALAGPAAVLLEAATTLGERLGAARVGYAEDGGDGETVAVTTHYTDGAPAIEGRYRYADYGLALLEAMRRGDVVVRPDIARDPSLTPEERAAHAALQLGSTVNLPLIRDGRLAAILFVHQGTARHWTEDELSLIRDTGERTWEAVERARAEAALRESEARVRRMGDAIPQIVWITDGAGRVEFMNRQWSDYTGVAGLPPTAAEIAAAAVHPDDAAETMRLFAEAGRCAGRFQVEHRIRSAAGEYRWFLVRAEPYCDPGTGEIVRWYGSSTDIHDRRVAEEALRASEARYRALFNSVDSGFCILEMIFDADGRPADYRFLETNPAFEEQTGLRGGVGRTARELVPELESFWVEVYGGVALTGEPRRFVSHAESMGRWFDVHASRVGDPELRQVAVLFSDITERKRAEEERERLLASEREARAEAEAANRAKMDFLSAMSHELRTPLNAIGGYVELLDLGIHGPLGDTQRGALARVTANQRHLLTLINDVLAFAKVEAGQVELTLAPVPAHEFLLGVEPLVGALAQARGIALTALPCDPELRAVADEERVRQILLNLVSNAIKFTPRDGAVTLSCHPDGEWLAFRVEDTGAGIPPEKHARIFEPFVQVDRRLSSPKEGIGLGLAISRDLARAMGGDLAVQSAPGEGSTFILRLPRAP